MREVRVVFVVFCFETCHLGIAHWDATHGLTARSGTLSDSPEGEISWPVASATGHLAIPIASPEGDTAAPAPNSKW